MNDLCIFFYLFLFKNHFGPKKLFLFAEINLTTLGPLYTCLVISIIDSNDTLYENYSGKLQFPIVTVHSTSPLISRERLLRKWAETISCRGVFRELKYAATEFTDARRVTEVCLKRPFSQRFSKFWYKIETNRIQLSYIWKIRIIFKNYEALYIA